MQYPKVVNEWRTDDSNNRLHDYDSLPAWGTVTIAAVLLFWCLAEVLMT